MSKWISVKDKLPEKYCDGGVLYNCQTVLVCLANQCVCEAWWNGVDFTSIVTGIPFRQLFKEFNPVTHWMPLPQPAKA